MIKTDEMVLGHFMLHYSFYTLHVPIHAGDTSCEVMKCGVWSARTSTKHTENFSESSFSQKL